MRSRSAFRTNSFYNGEFIFWTFAEVDGDTNPWCPGGVLVAESRDENTNGGTTCERNSSSRNELSH